VTKRQSDKLKKKELKKVMQKELCAMQVAAAAKAMIEQLDLKGGLHAIIKAGLSSSKKIPT
jgi:hypothetical protein